MTCPTCEAPPTEPLPKQGPHHVAVRFGDTLGMGQAVLYRGNVVTAAVVEAMAGPPGAGWVEMWLCDADGTPIIHKAAPRQCSDCDAELAEDQADEDGCEACGYVGPSYRAWQAHVATTIRHGHVAILRGRELITAPAVQDHEAVHKMAPAAVDVNAQARGMAAVFLAEHPELAVPRPRVPGVHPASGHPYVGDRSKWCERCGHQAAQHDDATEAERVAMFGDGSPPAPLRLADGTSL